MIQPSLAETIFVPKKTGYVDFEYHVYYLQTRLGLYILNERDHSVKYITRELDLIATGRYQVSSDNTEVYVALRNQTIVIQLKEKGNENSNSNLSI